MFMEKKALKFLLIQKKNSAKTFAKSHPITPPIESSKRSDRPSCGEIWERAVYARPSDVVT